IRLPHSQIFDTVMLRVLRGVPTEDARITVAQPAPPGVTVARFESLLADKYGLDTLTGTARPNGTDQAVVEKPPVIRLPSVALDGNPADVGAFDLVGRVLTLLGPGRDPSSHRILRAEKNGGSFFIVVDNQPRNRQFEAIPAGSSCGVVINGREFTGDGTAAKPHEPWDGFDATNPFLARVLPRDIQNKPDSNPTSVSSSVVKKPGFVEAVGAPPPDILGLLASGINGFDHGADNDNDGVKDGFFLDFGLPTVIAPNGDQIVLHASVLVADLDGRVNVNAHGSLVPIVYPQTARSGTYARWNPGNLPTGFPGAPAGALAVPTGSGYGPAEVNIDLLFPQVNPATTTYDVQRLRGTSPQNYPLENPAVYLRVGMPESRMADPATGGRTPFGSRYYADLGGDITKTPDIGAVEGRYGNYFARGYSSDNGKLPTNKVYTLAQPDVRFFWPPGQTLGGLVTINDPSSAVNDHRSQIDPSTINDPVPRTLRHEGIPPGWWNADATPFNWADNTALVQATAGQNWKLPPPRATYNSPPDLHGRMKTYTVPPAAGAMVPQVCYVKPEWSRNGQLDVETRDDPYELRLDTRGPRNSWLKTPGVTFPNGNLFNVSELENILRPYDTDSTKLPPRLEGMLGSVAEEARLRITTDSWDTTAITGTAAASISNWVKTKLSPAVRDSAASLFGPSVLPTEAQLGGLLNREIARMERFDLARPLSGDKPPSYDIKNRYYAQRQAYFKDLYILLCALCGGGKGGFDADRCAQWAANVVEFRDADSTMTPFEYDITPEDGWDVDGDAKTVDGPQRKLVFGTERPEIVIAQTSAWEDGTTGELFVMLHRPWNANAFARTGPSTDRLVAAEACDPQFDAYASNSAKNPLNEVDLGRKSGAAPSPPGSNANVTDTATYPIWRLRIVDDSGATRYVRCDVSSAGSNEFVPASVVNTTTPRIKADGWLCLRGTNSLPAGQQVTFDPGAGASPDRVIANFRVPGTCPLPGEQDRTAVVYLERLTDPTSSPQPADWNVETADPSAAPSSLPVERLERMAVYRVVDQAKIVIVNRRPNPDGSVPAGKNPTKLERRTDPADPAKTFWNNGAPRIGAALPTDGNFARLPSTVLGPYAATHAPSWFPWPNRPFVGSPELFFIHSLDSEKLLQDYTKPSLDPNAKPDHWTAGFLAKIGNPPLLDAVHVPTRFAGIHTSSTDPGTYLAKHAGLDQVTTPVNQLSSFREPGRVNLNTVGADDVWNAVVAGPLAKADAGNPNPDDPDPLKTRRDADFATKPVQSTAGLLALAGDKPPPGVQTPLPDTNAFLRDAIDRNALQGVYTATRLSNTATTRSHLFGVWITLREGVAPAGSPIPSDPDAVRYHRAFYIIDRSIPVAHEPGRDHNVWDAVLLRRIIE
ncbi:MAG: hypothetical protein ACKO3G_04915, partial [Planctomycetaceae bacterium]